MIGEGGIGELGEDFKEKGRFDGIEILKRNWEGEKKWMNDEWGWENMREFNFGISDMVEEYLLIEEN